MADCGLALPNVEDLSKEQDAVRALPPTGHHVVTGPPGSGKTVMALYRATQLNKRHGEKPALIMYNNLLSQYTAAASRKAKTDAAVRTLHKWFPSIYRAGVGHDPPKLTKYQFDWNKMLQEMAGGRLPRPDQTHVIVDEGQDFPNALYLVLAQITTSLTVFADENQQLKGPDENSSIEQIKSILTVADSMSLNRNYRNSLPIASVAARFHLGVSTGVATLPPATRPGDPVTLVTDSDLNGLIARLVRWEATHSQECVGVFVPYTKLQERIYNRLNGKTVNQVQIYSSRTKTMEGRVPIDFSEPGIKILAYASTKGLEFHTVFIPLLEQFKRGNAVDLYQQFAAEFYVMASRARRNLFFHYSGIRPPAILKHLPLDLMDDER